MREAFAGWNESHRIGNGLVETRVLGAVGPRVVELRRVGGPNLLYLRERELGGSGEPRWCFRGGWRLWVAPERRPATYAPDNDPCEVACLGPGTVRVEGPPQPAASIRKAVTITVADDAPRITLASTITNVGAEPVTYAPWTLAAFRPGGRAFLPLDVGPVDAFDAVRTIVLWSYAHLDDPRYRVGDRLIEIDHAAVVAGPPPTLRAPERTSDESKIGVDSVAGWAAYLLDDTLVVTHAAVEAGTRVDGGATLEAYSSREFIELEHLGPVVTLAPGAGKDLVETWSVFGDVTVPPASAGSEAILAALAPYVTRPPADA